MRTSPPRLWRGLLEWVGEATDDRADPWPSWVSYGPPVILLGIFILEVTSDSTFSRSPIIQLVAVPLLTLLLLGRRRWPVGILAVAVVIDVVLISGAAGLDWRLQLFFASGVAFMWLIYNAIRWAPQAKFGQATTLVAIVLALAVPSSLLNARDNDNLTASRAFLELIIVASLVIAVAALRRRQCWRAVAQQRLHELEMRNALANEVHDVVGHHLSAIALRAEAARSLLGPDEDSAGDALTAIRSAASSALDEIRSVVQGLSAPELDMTAKGPTLDDLDHLCRDDVGGLLITLDVDVGLREPPGPVSRAAYRIVQEAITNCRRHARAATGIAVVISSTLDRLTVQVLDNGQPSSVPAPANGHGLQAMSNRATALEGSFNAGPTPGGGWLVHAVFPL